MNYTEAINLAKEGDERGFDFLYAETFKSKYYLALQYMKNGDAAQDVLQDAYMKAFSNLDMMTNPEAFSGWLGRIVANTAKNALVKKNPLLFTDVAADDGKEGFEYQIEDDSATYQPETAYTKQETQEMVHELLDKLPAEQRMCVLMFHIEGNSIKEIASTLGCSENTVKSRLKYGRDNLKIEAEKLQKKGYKLYSIAPVPLLLHLFRTDLFNLSHGGGSFAMTGNQIARQVLSSQATAGVASTSVGTQGVANAGAQVAKTGIMSTTVGKVAVGVISLCLVGGGVAATYGISQVNANKSAPETTVAEGSVETSVTEEPVEVTPTAIPAPSTMPTATPTAEENREAIDAIYAKVRQAVVNQEPGYELGDENFPTVQYEYFLYDIDEDGIDEMIIAAVSDSEYAPVNSWYAVRAYSCEKSGNEYLLKHISGEMSSGDGNFCFVEGVQGLFITELKSRAEGKSSTSMVTIQEGRLLATEIPEYETSFEHANSNVNTYRPDELQWIKIADVATLQTTPAEAEQSVSTNIIDGKYNAHAGPKGATGFYSNDGSGEYVSFGNDPALLSRMQYRDGKIQFWGEAKVEPADGGASRSIKFDGMEINVSTDCEWFAKRYDGESFEDPKEWEMPEADENKVAPYSGGIYFTIANGKIVEYGEAGW